MAKLYFRYGAMNSGKSTALMQVAHNYEEQGMRVLILKPQVDSKGGGRTGQPAGRAAQGRPAHPAPGRYLCRRGSRPRLPTTGPWPACSATRASSLPPAQAEQLFMGHGGPGGPGDLLRPAQRFLPQGLPRLHPADGAGPYHRGDEDHLHLRAQSPSATHARWQAQFVFEGEQVAIDMENDVQYVSMCPQCYFRERRAFYARRRAGQDA